MLDSVKIILKLYIIDWLLYILLIDYSLYTENHKIEHEGMFSELPQISIALYYDVFCYLPYI